VAFVRAVLYPDNQKYCSDWLDKSRPSKKGLLFLS